MAGLRGLITILGAALAALSLGLPALAQEKLALVIGASNYGADREAREKAGFVVPGALANAARDAGLVGDALTAQGFKVTPVIDPDKRALQSAVAQFAEDLRNAGPDAVGVFYFAGHGAQGRPPLERDIDNYLIPLGADLITEADLDGEALGLRRISASLNPGANGAVVIVLDACRNFALPAADRSGFTDRGLAEARARAGTLIAYSTAPGRVAKDGPPGANGPYAEALARELRAAKGARLEDVFNAVRKSVLASTADTQQPWENSSLLRAVVLGTPDGTVEELTTGAPSTPTMDSSLEVFKLLASACEYAAFARDYPTSSAAALARTRAGGARPCDEGPSAREITTRIQTALIAMGCLEGAADGAAGPATRAGAARFRAAKGQSGTALDAAFMAAVEAASSEGFACPAIEPSPLPSARPAPQPAPFATATGRRAGEEFRDCSDCPVMVVVPAGSFTMGSPEGETGRYDDEGPQRPVTIPRTFAVGKFEVTWAEWEACVGGGGCSNSGPDGAGGDEGWGKGSRPVINVNWEDAQAYVGWLSSKTGERYRLLSEAEWEYAARAGTTTPFSFGGTISTDQANYDGNYTYGAGQKGEYRKKTTPVVSFPANPFGLHDMHGNVWEWVEDCHAESYSAGQPSDGSAYTTSDCSLRVLRGGSWLYVPQGLRSAYRFRNDPSFRSSRIGFRLARTVSPEG